MKMGRWISAAVALAVLVGGGVCYGFHIDLPRNEWSGWAQAGGAIVAIFVAIFVANLQFILAQRSERHQVGESMEALARLFEETISAHDLWNAPRAYEDPRVSAAGRRDAEDSDAANRRFQAGRDAVHGIRAELLRSSDEVRFFLDFRTVLDRLNSIAGGLYSNDELAGRAAILRQEGRAIAHQLRDAAKATRQG